MSYRVRFTTHTGATGYWDGTFATHTGASMSAQTRADVTGYTYTVEEVPDAPEPGSTAAHHVEMLRTRVEELEALVEERGRAVTDAHAANFVMYRHLEFALSIGDAMRDAMRTGQWRSGHDRSMANSAIAGWDQWRTSLAASPQGTAKASEAPRDGGDSDRRRLEALERWLKGDTKRLVYFSKRQLLVAISDSMMDEAVAPTLAALADKLAEKEAKP